MRLSLAALALALVAASPHATADILGGWIGPPGTTAANVISAFDDEADGNVAPAYLIGGPATGLETANGMSYSSDDGTVIVADFYGQQVKVFAPGTVGDSAPLRTFSHGSILQPRMAVALPGHDEIALVNFAFIQYYPRDADGTVAPLRSTAYAPGLLDNLSSLAYLPAFDQVAVGDGYTPGGGSSAGEVLFFDRTAAGTTPPVRRIAGPLTRLGAFVVGLAHDPVNGELFVLAANADDTATIQVFRDDASGDVGSLAYYPLRDQLLVASGAYNDVPRLLAFPRLANGNVAPERMISGPATGVGSPNGWTGVVGVPPVQLFRHGFE
jgi:hypothetical protein